MIIGKACDKKRHISNINKFSSNVNEVTWAVLNSLFFFYKKISHAPKAQKAQNVQRRNQAKVQKNTKRKISE